MKQHPQTKFLITGCHGTIGQYLTKLLSGKHINFECWDRNTININDYWQMYAYIQQSKATTLIHLAALTTFDEQSRTNAWLVNYEWPSELAWICRQLNIRFIFISSNLVFGDKNGPYHPESKPLAQSGYGYEKRKAEERVHHQNPEATIIRLGWQIAERGENSMIAWFKNLQNKHQKIELNTNWFPSASFVEDTCEALLSINSSNGHPPLIQLNSNFDYSIDQLARFIQDKFKFNWNIISTNGIYSNQIMKCNFLNFASF